MLHECGGKPDESEKPLQPAEPLSHPEQVLNIVMDELIKALKESPLQGLENEPSQAEIDEAINLILKEIPYQLDYTELNVVIQDKLRSSASYVVLFQQVATTSYSSLVTDLHDFLKELVGFHDLKLKGLTGSNPLDVSRWAVQGPSLRRSLSAKKSVFLDSLSGIVT